MNTDRAYIDTLTPLRGIAAFWVVLFHFDSLLRYMQYAPLVPGRATGVLLQGYLWVDFFFILSGFIIAHTYGDYFREGVARATFVWYAAARFSRIYPLHLFWLGVHLLLFVLMSALWPALASWAFDLYPSYRLGELLPNLLLLHAMNTTGPISWNIPSWSIAAEWWTYLAFLPLFRLLHGRTGRPLLLAVLLSFVTLTLLVAVSVRGSLDIAADYGLIRCFADFTLGVVMYQLYWARRGAAWLRHDLSGFGALAAVVLAFHFQLPDLLLMPMFCWLLLSAAHNDGALTGLARIRTLRWLGDISYSIYMGHIFWLVLLWVGVCVYKEHVTSVDPGQLPKLLALALLVLLVLATATLTYHLIEIPSRAWLRQRIVPAKPALEAHPAHPKTP